VKCEHDWVMVPETEGLSSMPMMVCTDCGEVGWWYVENEREAS